MVSSPGEPLKVEEFRRHFLGTFGREWRRRLTVDEARDAAHVLFDDATLYRHLQKTDGDLSAAFESLTGHLDWRRDNDVGASVSALISSMMSAKSNSTGPAATEGENLCVLLGGMDVHGRPLLFIKPRVLGSLAVARAANDLCVASELGRRRIASLQKPEIHQLSLIIDLNGFGFSHFSYELIPALHELFSRQYPLLLGTVYVLNYGWVHAGLWRMLQPMLSKESSARIQFLDTPNLLKHVPSPSLPVELGGQFSSTLEEEGEALQLLLQEETDPKFLDIQKQILAASFATAEYNESWDEDNQQEDEIWYEAREVLQDPRVRSAADLQRLLHASSVVSMGGSASPLSNKRRLWSSTSLSESGARRRGLASPIKGPNFTASPERRSRPPRFVHRVVGEVVRSPCPEIGLFQGLSMALVDWGQSWWQRPVSPPSKTPRKRIRYGAILIILGLIALAFVIFRRRIHFKSTTETRFP